jgi:2-polyprenyl-6-methoxyphenol hydroxylase-like FAD-dependent oxidoreductase
VLDKLLVDAASEAGAELREEFTVEDVIIDDGRVTGIRGHDKGGETVTELADVVVGADGRYSLVAKAVGPEQYNERPEILSGYYAYWSDLPVDGFETVIRPDRGWAALCSEGQEACLAWMEKASQRASRRDRSEIVLQSSLLGWPGRTKRFIAIIVPPLVEPTIMPSPDSIAIEDLSSNRRSPSNPK